LVSNLLNRDRKQRVHMRIALSAWAGQISPVFDSADHVVLFDMKRGKVQSQINATLGSQFPTERVTKLKAFGADTLVCGAVSSPLAEMLKCSGIKVISFVSGEVGTVLNAFLNGMLPSQELTMPGCWKGKGRRRKHRGVSAVRREDPTKRLVENTEGDSGIQMHE
jgi:predicted Fe-Mo cluster-binding NifX family protein